LGQLDLADHVSAHGVTRPPEPTTGASVSNYDDSDPQVAYWCPACQAGIRAEPD